MYADLLKDASGSADTARMLRGLAIVAISDGDRYALARVGGLECVPVFTAPHARNPAPGALAEMISRAGAFIPAEPGLLRSVWWKALLRHKHRPGWVAVRPHGWDGGFRPDDEQPETYRWPGGKTTCGPW